MDTRHTRHPGPRLAVSVDDAARMLSVSRRHLYTLLEASELRSFTSRRRRLVRLVIDALPIGGYPGIDGDTFHGLALRYYAPSIIAQWVQITTVFRTSK